MKKVLLLLAKGFEVWEASVFVDVIGWNKVNGNGLTELYSCGFSKEVQSSFNQCWRVDYLIENININDFDALAIPGGFEEFGFYTEAYRPEFLQLIQEFNKLNKPIASVCVAALPLGKSGILKGKSATTYQLNPVRQQSLAEFGAKVLQEPIVVHNNIITSWDPSTAMDVAFILLEKLSDSVNMLKMKEIMGFA